MDITFDVREKAVKLSVHKKQINELICAFKVRENILVDGEVVGSTTSDGVCFNSDFYEAISKFQLPKHNPNFIFKSDDILKLVKKYGHPSSLNKKSIFNGREIHTEINNLLEDSLISFAGVTDTSVNDLVYINDTYFEIVSLKDNSLFNIGRDLNSLFLQHQISKFEEFFSHLILIGSLTKDDGGTCDGQSFNDWNVVNFSDLEYDSIVKFIDKKQESDFERVNFTNPEIFNAIKSLNIFNIQDFL